MWDMTYEEYMGEPFRMWHNGIDYSNYFSVLEVSGRSLSPNEIQSLVIPGMPGSHFQSKRKQGVPLIVKAMLNKKSRVELRQAIDELNGMLDTNEPVPIEFSDEPTKTYYGILSDISEGREVRGIHIVTITFWRGDPYKYGEEIEATFPTDVVSLNYGGTAEGDPVFEMEVNKAVTFAMIQNQDDEYIMLGKPVDVSKQTPIQKEQIILDDNLETTTGWTAATSVENGVVAGQMGVSDGSFYASDYGTGTGWHGPSLKKSLTEPLQDFRAEFYLLQDTFADVNTIGRVELYLLDVNGNVVSKLTMRDSWVGQATNFVDVGLGTPSNRHLMLSTSGQTKSWWNKFQGVIRIQRIGKEFYVYVANITRNSENKHYRVWGTGFRDNESKYQTPIAQVQIHLGKMGTYATPTHLAQRVRVYKINQNTENEIPYIANAGDKIMFDHQQKEILINGESRKDLKDFGATYFKLAKGQNTLVVHPPASFNVTCKYRERFK